MIEDSFIILLSSFLCLEKFHHHGGTRLIPYNRSKPNPDVIRKYHAATLPEAVDGVRALQEQGSFIDCGGVMAQEYVFSEVNRRVKGQIAPGLRKVEIVPAKLIPTIV